MPKMDWWGIEKRAEQRLFEFLEAGLSRQRVILYVDDEAGIEEFIANDAIREWLSAEREEWELMYGKVD